jgi:hypothetical protein
VCGVVNLNSIQKCTIALHMLAYGQTIDAYDEYRRIDESAYFKTFVKTVMEVFQHEFL